MFRIVPVDEGNAHHVGSVFRSVYGEEFPVKSVYDPGLLLDEIRSGRLIAALALDSEKKPGGYVSMFQSAPNPRLWEAGNIIVVPVHARTRLSSQLADYFFNVAFHGAAHADGLFGESVCSHYFSQFYAIKNHMIDCALELDQMDGGGFKDKKSNKAGAARVSCVLSFREGTDMPDPEYVPIRYDQILRHIAGSLRVRTLLASAATIPDEGETVTEERYFEYARTMKIAVSEIGGNWPEKVKNILADAKNRQLICLQVVLNMACPHVGAATDILWEEGFFFGGLAPRWFGTDGLFMQYLFGSATEYDTIKLYSKTAKELLAFIRSDREAVRGNKHVR